MKTHERNTIDPGLTLVTGGTGKTGRRVAERLCKKGVHVRAVSRSTTPAFDWNDRATWKAALAGVKSAYVAYAPDLAVPGAGEAIRAFVDEARACGVERLVLLSGRGEQEAQACERIVQESGMQWTVVRSAWFMQNFSEGEFRDMVRDGAITLPAADIPEPFIDVNDIADVAVAALTEEGHAGEVYEVTGPRAITFGEAARQISKAIGRKVAFVRIPGEAFTRAIAEAGVPADVAWLLDYLFDTVLDGRNSGTCDGVQRALGRAPAGLATFARRIADRGDWATGTREMAA